MSVKIFPPNFLYKTGTFFGSSVDSASYAITASWAPGALVGGNQTYSGTFTGSTTGSLFGTSSWANSSSVAVSASWAPGGNIDLSAYVQLSNIQYASSSDITRSFIQNSASSSFLLLNNLPLYVSSSVTGVFLQIVNLSTYASSSDITRSFIQNSASGNFLQVGNLLTYASSSDITRSFIQNSITGNLLVTGSLTGSVTGNILGSSSYAQTASYALGSITNFSTGNYTGSVTGNILGSSSYALSASWTPGGSSLPTMNDGEILFGDGTNTPITTASLYFDNVNQSLRIGAAAFDLEAQEGLRLEMTGTSYNAMNAHGNVNTYFQINIENDSQGFSSSADLVATADYGSETRGYVDLGINGSKYSDANYSMTTASDGYIMNAGNSFAIINSGSYPIKFAIGGFTANKEIAKFTTTGLSVTGSITSSLSTLQTSYYGRALSAETASVATSIAYWTPFLAGRDVTSPTNKFTSSDTNVRPGVPIRFKSSTSAWNYSHITGSSNSTYSVEGVALNSASITVTSWEYGNSNLVRPLEFSLLDYYASTNSTGALYEQLGLRYVWKWADAHLIDVDVINGVNDAGTAASMSVAINGTNVLPGKPLSIGTAWADAGIQITQSLQDIRYNDTLELLIGKSQNGTARNLTAILIFVSDV